MSEAKFVGRAAKYVERIPAAAGNALAGRSQFFNVAASFAALAVTVGAVPETTAPSHRVVEMGTAGIEGVAQAGLLSSHRPGSVVAFSKGRSFDIT